MAFGGESIAAISTPSAKRNASTVVPCGKLGMTLASGLRLPKDGRRCGYSLSTSSKKLAP
jgi:hypothetical protein